jgi:alpha-tubulin suppressor-like RCC1 family protein
MKSHRLLVGALLLAVAAPGHANNSGRIWPVAIAAGGGASVGHSLVLESNGTARSFGEGSGGQLGNNGTNDALSAVTVWNISTATAVAAGSRTSYALLSNGYVWSWGDNLAGDLGDGSNVEQNVPVLVSGLHDWWEPIVGFIPVTAIAAGGTTLGGYGLALRQDGTVRAWGENGSGQLGDGTQINRPTAVVIPELSNTTAIAAGKAALTPAVPPTGHSLALRDDGTVWAWGDNSEAELGDGTFNNHLAPVQASVSNVIAIDAGYHFSVAIVGTGTVQPDNVLYAWGDNDYGQLGVAPSPWLLFPSQVPGIDHLQAVSAGPSFVLALRSDGTVWAWGSNAEGQLGDGTMVDHFVPAQVQGLSSIVAIAAGNTFGLALRSDSTVWSWGRNLEGELGDGTGQRQLTPVAVHGL